MQAVTDLPQDEEVATRVTSDQLRLPTVGRGAMQDDTTRILVNRAQFDHSEQTRDRMRERTPAVRKIEHCPCRKSHPPWWGQVHLVSRNLAAVA
ncbi:DUF6192 family protein [Streptomyces sp. OE57]|uniref:DUF6192 family protein n=1 Tax=Streptomyces lacaronensis TaxID=3379885 RepID=UPI0039B75618